MRKCTLILFLFATYFFSQGCGISPKPIKLSCALNNADFYNRAQDSLRTYSFHILTADSSEIQTIRKIEDGLSNRTVYLTLNRDSSSEEWNMVVRTIVAYHGEINEFYLDEQPRLTNDFRRDFKPVLGALRSMCVPPPKKKKKKTT